MSWELDYCHKQKCYCGKGHIVSKCWSDDWGRTDHSDYTDCKECYEKMIKYQDSESFDIANALGKRAYSDISLVDDINKYCEEE